MEIYEPREDSFLLQKCVEEFAFGKVLDMGTGSGMQAEAAAKKGCVKSVLAADINPAAVKKANGKIRYVNSDLFSTIPRQKFDTIIFNPPYLPQDKGIEDEALYGGKKGHETVQRFLEQSPDYMADRGIILLLFSTLTRKHKIDEIMENLALEYEIVAYQPIFFEKLYCYLIRKSPLLDELERRQITGIRKVAKGHRGIVYKGVLNGKTVAVKAEGRQPGSAGRALREAEWLKMLNKKRIGPKLLLTGKNYLAYEFVDGQFILDFITAGNRQQIVKVIKDVLNQCVIMDRMGINKEELHHPFKHIIVNANKATMIDFERCRKTKKPANATQFLQFLSTRRINAILQEKGLKMAPQEIRETARAYRHKGEKALSPLYKVYAKL